MAKFIFVTGGVVSSLGKGVTAASIGRLLISRGLRIRMQKLDPYLNVDPGTMNPYQHGEVYVTNDGTETDLDLGHYERFTGLPTAKTSNYTAGSIYWDVLQKERRGDYLGATIQMIPHITDRIKKCIRSQVDTDVDVILCELGGTVGDIESLTFLEAIRQVGQEEGRHNVLYLHLTYVPYLAAAGEVKTKPTQQSTAKLREIGIIPDVIICRSEVPLAQEDKKKISLFCNVPLYAVIEEQDVEHTIYEIPLVLYRQGLDEIILSHFGIAIRKANLTQWRKMVKTIIKPSKEVCIGVVGKYSELQDAYKSVYEALDHAGIHNDAQIILKKLPAEDFETTSAKIVAKGIHGLLVPGGFGYRGSEGKIKAIRYARENNIPFFGICLGLQCAVIEFARNVCKLKKAHSSEFNPDTPHPVVCLMEEQEDIVDKGGTMRLGAWPCYVKKGTRAMQAYHKSLIHERHRHRYEVNNKYRKQLEEKGLMLCGLSPDKSLVEMVEIKEHRWFVAVQFHPEFQSQPIRPHPLFKHFVTAALDAKND